MPIISSTETIVELVPLQSWEYLVSNHYYNTTMYSPTVIETKGWKALEQNGLCSMCPQ